MSYVSELISRVVSAHELSPDDFGVKAELFADFADEWRFLSDYQKRFRKLPNVATFMLQFPEFPFINSDHNAEWLLEEVEQECAGHVFDAEMTDILDLRAVNPRDAAAKMYDLSVRIKQMTAVQQMRHSLKSGVYPADSITWRNELAKITTGIPTGFDLLDEVTFGTQPGEIEIWFGRPGEGKSLMLIRGAIAAQQSGAVVCYVSPEMTLRENQIRYDTMTVHVSSNALFSGKMDDAEYNAFIARKAEFEDATQHLIPIQYYEAAGRGGRFTTGDIARYAKSDKPDIFVIDGLMLLEPMKDDRDPRKRLINTMEELKTIATDTNIPIRLAHQANRESDVKSQRKSKKAYVIDELIPDLSHLAESGAVEQYANKAIAIKQTHGRTFLALRKNRNGRAPRFISFGQDIDHGMLWDIQLEQASLDPSERDVSIIPQADTSQLDRLPF